MTDKSWRIRLVDDRIEFTIVSDAGRFVLRLTPEFAADMFQKCADVSRGHLHAAGGDE